MPLEKRISCARIFTRMIAKKIEILVQHEVVHFDIRPKNIVVQFDNPQALEENSCTRSNLFLKDFSKAEIMTTPIVLEEKCTDIYYCSYIKTLEVIQYNANKIFY